MRQNNSVIGYIRTFRQCCAKILSPTDEVIIGQVYEGREPRCTMGVTEVGPIYIRSYLPDGRASSPFGSCDQSTSSKQHQQPKTNNTTTTAHIIKVAFCQQ